VDVAPEVRPPVRGLVAKVETGEGDAEADGTIDDATEELGVQFRAAFLALQEEMEAEGTGTWFSAEPESWPLRFEVPATWLRSADGKILWDPEQPGSAPTAQVYAPLTTWGDAGQGLLIMMSGVGYPVASQDLVNQLNRLDEPARGTTHFISTWLTGERTTTYSLFLPATFLHQPGIIWPAVMREVLLTVTRQAQLARRVLFDEQTLRMLDGGTTQPVGFEASRKPHGLAWGETGAGHNPAAWYLNEIYGRLVAGDGEWAYPAEHGFRWWPHEQAQHISVEGLGTRAGLDEDYTWRHVSDGLGVLDGEGVLTWVKDRRDFTFETDAGPAFVRPERLEDFRPHGGTALRLTVTVSGVPPTDGVPGSTAVSSMAEDANVLGTWSHGPDGLRYEVTIPPIGALLGSDFAIKELVTWVARHMLTRVQQVLARRIHA
jgi:hypothetical protein